MRHNGGGGLRGFVGALKDKASQTRATLHLLPQPPNPYHLHLLRSTTHSPSSPPSLRHLSYLISLSQSSRASASSLVSSLMDRLCQTRSSPVALKCLFAFHFFLRHGPFILLDQLSFLPLRGGRNYLNLSGFRDDSYPLSWELSGWVRWYAAYLERAVSASRALGHHFLNSACTSGEEVAGSEESKVSGFANQDLLNEIESLAGLIEETSRIPESCDDNLIVRAIKEFVLDDCSPIVRAVSVRVNEFEERLDLLSFADSVELVCSLKRLEACWERVAEMFDRAEKAAGASRRVWDSIRVMRGKVGAGKKSVEVEPVKGKENGAWSESARFDGGRIPSLCDSALFLSGRLGSDFHTSPYDL